MAIFAEPLLIKLLGGIVWLMSSKSALNQQKLLRRVDGDGDICKRLRTVELFLPPFRFLSVKVTETSAQLTWTHVGSRTRYLIFSQDSYGVFFTKKNRFQFVGLEPGKTYNVFAVAINLGPEYIAFTAFETNRKTPQVGRARLPNNPTPSRRVEL